jgi:hypothetical protein
VDADQGPRTTSAAAAKPWTSLDFSGGDGIVRAAADGSCTGHAPISWHGGGWETGYFLVCYLAGRDEAGEDAVLLIPLYRLGHSCQQVV